MDSTINKLNITDEIRFKGNADAKALIQKNASNGRDELQIYASGDASGSNSKGAGIQLYGNEDSLHSGNIAMLTGDNDNGTARMIISQRGNVTIGEGIWDFVDEGHDDALLSIVKDGVCVASIDSEGNINSPVIDELEERLSKIEAWIKGY